jgi:hypothetical protein
LHTSFRLPVRGSTWELSVADLTELQARFKDVKYLIVDEKSMVDLKTLGIIDERLREIFPDKNMLPFGGLNVVVTGDNWQLQPVGGHPLFRASSDRLGPIALKGQNAYRLSYTEQDDQVYSSDEASRGNTRNGPIQGYP